MFLQTNYLGCMNSKCFTKYLTVLVARLQIILLLPLMVICLRLHLFFFSEDMGQETRTNLDATVIKFRKSALADSTKKSYRTYLVGYVKFCALLHISLVPISPQNLGRFVAYLSCKLSFNSITN